MPHTTDPPEIEQGLSRLRLIVFALMAGTLVFGLAVWILVASGFDTHPETAPILLLCLTVLGIGEISAYPLLRRLSLRKLGGGDPRSEARAAVDTRALEAYTSLTIVGAAMCEGFVMFSLVVYLLTGTVVALVAAGLGFLLITTFLPNREKLGAFAAAAAGHPG